MFKKLAIALVTALALTVTLSPTPAHAAPIGYPYTIGGQVTAVAVLSRCNDTSRQWTYLLDTKGGVYTGDDGTGYVPNFYGSAAGQSYFVGRTAYAIELFTDTSHCTVTGYKIFSTANEQYNYGNTSTRSNGFVSRYTQGFTPFWLNGSVCHIQSPNVNGVEKVYVEQCNGGIFTLNAPFYGSAAGQGYFAGRTLSYVVFYGSPSGYCIIATSSERYCYGSVSGPGRVNN